jgi:uncharacterized protein YegL
MVNPNNTHLSTEYTTRWATATPGYIIFLIDQSRSMNTKYSFDENRAQFTARTVNDSIYNLITSNRGRESIKDRAKISIIGYGGEGGNAITVVKTDFLSGYAKPPFKTEAYSRKEVSEDGHLIERIIKRPVFLEPTALGQSPISDALKYAKRLIEEWVFKSEKNLPAPIVINITDGAPHNERHSKSIEIKEAIKVSKEIMKLKTSTDSPLIFNAHIEKDSGEILFPEDEYELNGNETAQFLYKISSPVPPAYLPVAKLCGLPIGNNSKGFIANATPDKLIKFIKFGTTNK